MKHYRSDARWSLESSYHLDYYRDAPETPGEEVDDTTANVSPTQHPFAETLLPSISLFFHALVIEWTLTFGFILTVAFEWWIFHGAGQDGMKALESQREVCFVLGLWMISIGLNSSKCRR